MDLKKEIAKLKEQKRAFILAHNYQIPEIQDLADFVGDSLELSKISKSSSADLVVFCGVKFMAQTAKILSPAKRVLLPAPDAGCPLSDTIVPEELLALKKKHPDAWVVSYVNTSAEIKAASDVCCTSSNAVSIVKNVPVKKIIFVPDKNLGWWVARNVPEKDIIIWQGFCYVHEQFTRGELEKAKTIFPDAVVLVHPECRQEVIERADVVLSTAGMLKYAKESKSARFIIGTEEGLLHKLKKENPAKEFYSLGCAKTCLNMKKTTLQELYYSLRDEVHEINLDKAIIDKASIALSRMV
ncbi:MAG: quinolinate synthase NadA, partial [Candidatus Omnitrophica bacterium]|nr:quinolinate synthase NadA [Candidatus Omnitrophota bacterium]